VNVLVFCTIYNFEIFIISWKFFYNSKLKLIASNFLASMYQFFIILKIATAWQILKLITIF